MISTRHPIHTEERNGCSIKIYIDDDARDPRDDDNFGHMICFHRRYTLGDKHSMSIEEAQELAEADNVISLPLYLYDHSGITISTSDFGDRWDSGQVGFIYCTEDDIAREYGAVTADTMEKARALLKNEVKAYDLYLTGKCYGYVVHHHISGKEDSCCGFYDFANTIEEHCVLSEARNAATSLDKEYEVNERLANREMAL